MSQFVRRPQRILSPRRLILWMVTLMTVGLLGALPATASAAEQTPSASSANEQPSPKPADADDGESTEDEQAEVAPEDDATDKPTGEEPSDDPKDESPEKSKSSRLAAAALAAQGCGYANTSANNGVFAGSICWFDFTGFDEVQARTADGQPFEITLEGNYTARFVVKVTDLPGRSTTPIAARTTPLETRFAFGTDAYRGVPNRPALYSQPAPGGNKGAKLSLEDIEVVDSDDNPVTGYSFVAADSEDNVSGESFTWTSDQALREIERLAPSGAWGCKSPTGLGTTEVNCDGTGAGGSSTAGGKSTALLVAANTPSTFSTAWRTHAQSGIAIGIQTATVSVTKQIGSRFNPDDAFDVSIASPEGATLASASTGTATTATTGRVTILPQENGGAYTLSEAMAAGSPTPLANYTAAWSCANDNTSSSTTLPSGNGFSKTVVPVIGDGIQCTITNNVAADYGDATDQYGTLRASDGPSHLETPGLKLGTLFDREGDGQPTSLAVGDDNSGTDDEDATGAILLSPGVPTTVPIAVTNDTDEAATLAGWLDADADLQFETSERIVVTVPANSGNTSHDLVFPARTPVIATRARFRLFPGTVADPSPRGAASGGEVEDHSAGLRPIFDFGDAPNSYGTTLASNGARSSVNPRAYLGSPADEDSDGRPSPAANGDDLAGIDDEDGVSAPIVQTAGQATTVTVTATNTTPFNYSVAGWIDLDNDGTFENPTERQGVPVPPNSGTANYTLTFPAATVAGDTFARFRMHSTAAAFAQPTGAGGFEIEDYPVGFEGPGLEVTKSASPVSGTAVIPGQEVTYTLTFDNSDGALPSAVRWNDHLAGVLDDATLSGGPTAGAGLTVTPVTDGSFDIGGTVPAGQTRTVTYAVTVGGQDERTDSVLNNFLMPTGEDPQDGCLTVDATCTTNPVAEFADSKSVSPASGSAVGPGDELTYALRFENTGAAPVPVNRVDDLTHLLDDATVATAPVSSDEDALQVSEIANGRFSITGEVPKDGVVTVTYTVTVNQAADRDDDILANYLLGPNDQPPAEPVCADNDDDCTANPVRELVDSKAVSPDSGGAVAGQELTYTLTFENLGAVAEEVDRVDDLTHVLDDATVTSAPVSSDAALEVSAITDDRYSITGELEPGSGPVTVTYTVTVNPDGERGDDLIGNFLLDPDEEPPVVPICLPGAEDCTVTGVSEIVDSKSVSPDSGSVVVPGQDLTYTLSFENVGAGPGEVDRVDDLTHVLDDATVTSAPAASDDALTVSSISNGRFTITGTLDAGQTVTVTYTVRVDEFDDLGDQVLANFLLSPDAETRARDHVRTTIRTVRSMRSATSRWSSRPIRHRAPRWTKVTRSPTRSRS